MPELTWTQARERRELRWGLLGVLVLVVAVVAVGVVYVLPIGKATYTAYLTEAQSIRAGDQVRVAGITVGSVTALELEPNRVRMSFTVDNDVFLGAQTTLEIRMLTVVGGHYVAVFPAGDTALGSTTVPADRVRLPYSLVRTLQDVRQPVAEVDGVTLRENFAALQDALDDSPDGLRRMGTAMETFVGILDRQNADVSRALTVMTEYLGAIDDNRAVVGTFVRQIGMLETEGLNKRAEIDVALRIAAELLSRIAAVEPSWRTQLQPLVDRLLEALPQLEDAGARLTEATASIADFRGRLAAAVTTEDGVVVDESSTSVGSTICVPVPGRTC